MKSQSRSTKNLVSTALAATAAIAASNVSYGQSSSPALEEVIVSATRRDQKLEDIPASIAVLSSESIERKNLEGMDDYLRSVAGVAFADIGAGSNFIVMRGISVDPQFDDSTTTVYFDEVPLSRGGDGLGSPDLKLVDMQRVEVLRGPQGTVYGASSMGGAVRQITVRPDLTKLTARVEGSYSTTSGTGGGNDSQQAVFNLPLVQDRLALRAVGYRFQESGVYENVAADDPEFVSNAETWGVADRARNQDNVGNTETVGGRVEMLWQATDNLSLNALYLKQKMDQEGFPETQLGLGGYRQARLQLVGGAPESLHDENELINLVANYELGWGSLLSSTSWKDQEWNREVDLGHLFGGVPFSNPWLRSFKSFIEEVRFTSKFDSPLQVLAGGYYEDSDSVSDPQGYYGGDPALNPYGDDVFLFRQLTKADGEQLAFFGELSYDVTEKLNITGGVRHYSYKSHAVTDTTGTLLGPPSTRQASSEGDGQTYKAHIGYRPTKDILLYAQFAQGFRPGGNQQQPLPPICDQDSNGIIDGTNFPNTARQLKPDDLDNYEVGGKFALLDHRLTIDAAIYRINWTGLPVSPNLTCGITFTVNAGKAVSQGLEMESTLQATEKLQLSLNVGVVKAELAEDAASIGQDGDRLPGSPKFTGGLGAQYDFTLGSFPSYVRGDYSYVGGFYNNFQQIGPEAGSYSQVNVKFGIEVNKFKASLFVNNLTDDDALTWVQTVYADGRASRLRPRTIGVSMGYEF